MVEGLSALQVRWWLKENQSFWQALLLKIFSLASLEPTPEERDERIRWWAEGSVVTCHHKRWGAEVVMVWPGAHTRNVSYTSSAPGLTCYRWNWSALQVSVICHIRTRWTQWTTAQALPLPLKIHQSWAGHCGRELTLPPQAEPAVLKKKICSLCFWLSILFYCFIKGMLLFLLYKWDWEIMEFKGFGLLFFYL